MRSTTNNPDPAHPLISPDGSHASRQPDKREETPPPPSPQFSWGQWLESDRGILVLGCLSTIMVLAILLGTLIPLARAGVQYSPPVNLTYSTYQGVSGSDGVDKYLGMRYAEPPLGDLRFRAPRDPLQTGDIQDAIDFGPICVGTDQAVSDDKDEDCLFINVFKPSNATSLSNLPVWVYIQGGGYATNSNANYDGTNVVRESGHGIVLVNFNYRVGALGFLASEKVRKDGDLNVGLLDQRKALHWVQKYIHLFGGNPSHVVIHGASAGGGSVSYHLTAYGGRNDHLFIGGAPESPFWPTQRTVSEMEFQFDRFAEQAGCASAPNALECLRSADITSLQSANIASPFPGASDDPLTRWFFLPVIDGDFIRERLYSSFTRGRFVRVPLLIGGDNNEGSYFAYNATNQDEVAQFFKNNYPGLNSSDTDDINGEYPEMDPLPEHAAYFPSASAAYGDCLFTCPGNHIATSMSRHFSAKKVWNYRCNIQDPDLLAQGLGVPHTFETEAIFGPGYGGGANPTFTGENAAIVPITMHYYISFVKALDPNRFRDESAPYWMPWGEGTGERLRLQTGETRMEAVPGDLVDKCGFWRELSTAMEV